MADFTRSKQVLINFLSNAIKYNRDGGRVELAWGNGDEGGCASRCATPASACRPSASASCSSPSTASAPSTA
jgi:signal transduction histidine kinase